MGARHTKQPPAVATPTASCDLVASSHFQNHQAASSWQPSSCTSSSSPSSSSSIRPFAVITASSAGTVPVLQSSCLLPCCKRRHRLWRRSKHTRPSSESQRLLSSADRRRHPLRRVSLLSLKRLWQPSPKHCEVNKPPENVVDSSVQLSVNSDDIGEMSFKRGHHNTSAPVVTGPYPYPRSHTVVTVFTSGVGSKAPPPLSSSVRPLARPYPLARPPLNRAIPTIPESRSNESIKTQSSISQSDSKHSIRDIASMNPLPPTIQEDVVDVPQLYSVSQLTSSFSHSVTVSNRPPFIYQADVNDGGPIEMADDCNNTQHLLDATNNNDGGGRVYESVAPPLSLHADTSNGSGVAVRTAFGAHRRIPSADFQSPRSPISVAASRMRSGFAKFSSRFSRSSQDNTSIASSRSAASSGGGGGGLLVFGGSSVSLNQQIFNNNNPVSPLFRPPSCEGGYTTTDSSRGRTGSVDRAGMHQQQETGLLDQNSNLSPPPSAPPAMRSIATTPVVATSSMNGGSDHPNLLTTPKRTPAAAATSSHSNVPDEKQSRTSKLASPVKTVRRIFSRNYHDKCTSPRSEKSTAANSSCGAPRTKSSKAVVGTPATTENNVRSKRLPLLKPARNSTNSGNNCAKPPPAPTLCRQSNAALSKAPAVSVQQTPKPIARPKDLSQTSGKRLTAKFNRYPAGQAPLAVFEPTTVDNSPMVETAVVTTAATIATTTATTTTSGGGFQSRLGQFKSKIPSPNMRSNRKVVPKSPLSIETKPTCGVESVAEPTLEQQQQQTTLATSPIIRPTIITSPAQHPPIIRTQQRPDDVTAQPPTTDITGGSISKEVSLDGDLRQPDDTAIPFGNKPLLMTAKLESQDSGIGVASTTTTSSGPPSYESGLSSKLLTVLAVPAVVRPDSSLCGSASGLADNTLVLCDLTPRLTEPSPALSDRSPGLIDDEINDQPDLVGDSLEEGDSDEAKDLVGKTISEVVSLPVGGNDSLKRQQKPPMLSRLHGHHQDAGVSAMQGGVGAVGAQRVMRSSIISTTSSLDSNDCMLDFDIDGSASVDFANSLDRSSVVTADFAAVVKQHQQKQQQQQRHTGSRRSASLHSTASSIPMVARPTKQRESLEMAVEELNSVMVKLSDDAMSLSMSSQWRRFSGDGCEEATDEPRPSTSTGTRPKDWITVDNSVDGRMASSVITASPTYSMRPPGALTVDHSGLEQVSMDPHSFAVMCQEVTSMKKMLHQLNRILQSVETGNPFETSLKSVLGSSSLPGSPLITKNGVLKRVQYVTAIAVANQKRPTITAKFSLSVSIDCADTLRVQRCVYTAVRESTKQVAHVFQSISSTCDPS